MAAMIPQARGPRHLFGGESKSFTALFDRARREAVARMAEAAREPR